MALCPLPSLSSPTPSSSSSSSDTALTTNHLISIPETLQSLSPPLAALHRARLRLLLDLPASPMGIIQPSKGLKGSGGWCNLCGGLREGLGGAQRGTGRNRQQSHPYKSISRLGSASNTRTIGDKLREQETLEGIFSNSNANSQSQTQTQTQTQTNMRKKGQCTTCGALYEKPKPETVILKTYGSARRVRRVRLQFQSDYSGQGESPHNDSHTTASAPASATSQLRGNSLLLSTLGDSTSTSDIDTATGTDEKQQSNSNQMDMDVDNIFSSPAPTPMSEEELASFSELINTADDTEAINTNTSTMDVELEYDFDLPVKPTLFAHPSLAHIPLSSPNLPTYPPPPPKKIQTPTPTPNSPRKYQAGGQGAVGGKRKKKSGLAKLLAENKEREERSENGGGLWGLQ